MHRIIVMFTTEGGYMMTSLHLPDPLYPRPYGIPLEEASSYMLI